MTSKLLRVARELVLQTYSARRYSSHGPTASQWLALAGALREKGVDLPDEIERTFGRLPDADAP